jgi:hypothetical protein
MTRLSPHQRIILERFGGVARLTALLNAHLAAVGKKRLAKSTVQGWKESGYIPSKHHTDVLEVGQSLDDPLDEREFFHVPGAALQGGSAAVGGVALRHS